MTQPLLLATDFSAPARLAAERALRLAQEVGAELALLHVLPGQTLATLRAWLDTLPGMAAGAPLEQALHDQARAQLEQWADELSAIAPVALQVHTAEGVLVSEINRVAERLDAGLLVLGGGGEGGTAVPAPRGAGGAVRRMLLGSTASRMLGHTRRPLLLVRLQPRSAYRRVLVAVDFSPFSLPALALAHTLGPHAELVLLHAFQVPFEDKLRFAGVETSTIEHYRQHVRQQAEQQLAALAAQAGLAPTQWRPLVIESDGAAAIVDPARDCDLAVVGKHGQSATQDLLLGSVTRRVLVEAACDVLVVPGAA